MSVAVHGLEARQGDTAFAFFVLRLATPVDRPGLLELIERVAPLVPDAERLVSELPDDREPAVRIVGLPWSPPEAGHEVDMQRRLIDGAASHGVEQAWFFQIGTSLASPDGDDDDDDPDDEDGKVAEVSMLESQTQIALHPISDDGWNDLDLGNDAATTLPMQRAKIEEAVSDADADADDEDGDDGDDGDSDDDDSDDEAGHDGDDDAAWSHGPLPQVTEVRFPVDGYPEILDELDWEDFGIACKLAGPWTAGESTVLLGFHAMWLAPYGERYRNAAVTIDRRHHAVHLWVDRFAVPCSPQEQVHHLLWIASKLDEVIPIVHARFGGATMAQKYGGMLGDTREPFVLGGNPLFTTHDAGGERAVDDWIAAQTDWSNDEIAQMLRELAIEIVMQQEAGSPADDDDDDDDDDESDDESDGNADDDVDDSSPPARHRNLAAHAADLLVARAHAGALDPRVAEKLRPVLESGEGDQRRRAAVVSVLGAARDRASVPAMVRILEAAPALSAPDAIAQAGLLTATANALAAIADPAAIPALVKLVGADGAHHDASRVAAGAALVACLAAGPEPAALDDEMFAAMARSIGETRDETYHHDMRALYGLLALQLPAERGDGVGRRLGEILAARQARHAAEPPRDEHAATGGGDDGDVN